MPREKQFPKRLLLSDLAHRNYIVSHVLAELHKRTREDFSHISLRLPGRLRSFTPRRSNRAISAFDAWTAIAYAIRRARPSLLDTICAICLKSGSSRL